MRICVGICVLTAAFFSIPTSAHARIALNRGTIVSIGVFEGEQKRVVFGSIVFRRGSLREPDKKSDLISAKITSQTSLGGDRNRRAFKFSDLKPGMAIEIVIVGRRGGTDPEWEVRSIRVIASDDVLKP